jgi:hypothetical protein
MVYTVWAKCGVNNILKQPVVTVRVNGDVLHILIWELPISAAHHPLVLPLLCPLLSWCVLLGAADNHSLCIMHNDLQTSSQACCTSHVGRYCAAHISGYCAAHISCYCAAHIGRCCAAHIGRYCAYFLL